MPETLAACPLCASPKRALFDRRDFKGIPITNQLCGGCGLVYQSPRMTEEEATEFYKREYRRLYQRSEGPSVHDIQIQQWRARHLSAFLKKMLPAPPADMIEIGASNGTLMRQLRADYGSRVVGVEPSEAYRQAAEAEGMAMYPDLDAAQAAGAQGFGLAALSHVLEHINDPVGFLAGLRGRMLAPGAHLLIEVPNLYAHESFEVGHLSNFSPHTLAETLRRAGFRTVARHLHGQPRSGNIPYYITTLAVADPAVAAAPVMPERFVGLKRQAGLGMRRVKARFLRTPGMMS